VLEGHEHHGEEPWTLPVAITINILAVFVAMATLLGHRASTEEILKQSESTDQWAYYQAKNIRLHEMQNASDLISVMSPVEKQKVEALQAKYRKEIERYEKEKDEISEKAKELETERTQLSRREDRFDAAEVILEIGLIICSLTLLTRRKYFWYSGMVVGVFGFLVGITGFLVH
jgi:hypothetical protein